jgi:hypothetical protein
MKRSVFLSLSIILGFLFVIGTVKNAYSQGYYTCQVSTICIAGTVNCSDTSCHPSQGELQSYCASINPSSCLGTHPCICPQPTSTQGLNSLYSIIQSRPALFNMSGSPGEIISSFMNILFPLVGLLLLLYLIYGGYNLMLSGGDPKKIQAAKSIITMALLGFVIIFASYWLVRIVGYVLGLDTFSSIFY